MNSSLCSSDKTSDKDASSTLNFSSGTKYIKKGRENSAEEKKLSKETFASAICVKTRYNKMKIKRLKEEKEQALKKAANSEKMF